MLHLFIVSQTFSSDDLERVGPEEELAGLAQVFLSQGDGFCPGNLFRLGRGYPPGLQESAQCTHPSTLQQNDLSSD